MEAQTNITKLRTGIDDVGNLIISADIVVRELESEVPKYEIALNKTKAQHEKLHQFIMSNLTYTLESIRYKINHARSLANSAPIAAKFGPTTTVTLESPIVEGEAETVAEMDIKTTEKEGLLMYIGGSSNTTRRRRQAVAGSDFMALTLSNGFVEFSAKTSGGMVKIRSMQAVSDDKWYRITAKR